MPISAEEKHAEQNNNLPQDLKKEIAGHVSGDPGDFDPNDDESPTYIRRQYLSETDRNSNWGKFQRFVTGKDYEEVYRLSNGREVRLDSVQSGYVVDAKWTGRNNSAWLRSPYNTFQPESRTIDQISRQIQFAQEGNLKGIRWMVSNSDAQSYYTNIFKQNFPKLYDSGFLRVYYTPPGGI